MQMRSACQNAVGAAQSALLAHADHVSTISWPCSLFMYLLWGVQGPHELNSKAELVKLIALLFWVLVGGVIKCLHLEDWIKPIFDNFRNQETFTQCIISVYATFVLMMFICAFKFSCLWHPFVSCQSLLRTTKRLSTTIFRSYFYKCV